METSLLKENTLRNRYPEWMPNLSLDRGDDSNPWGALGPWSVRGSTVPRWPFQTHTHTHTHTQRTKHHLGSHNTVQSGNGRPGTTVAFLAASPWVNE